MIGSGYGGLDQDSQDERMNRIPRTATASKLILSIFHLRPSASICGYLSPFILRILLS